MNIRRKTMLRLYDATALRCYGSTALRFYGVTVNGYRIPFSFLESATASGGRSIPAIPYLRRPRKNGHPLYYDYISINEPLSAACHDDYLSIGYFRMGSGMYEENMTYYEGRFLNSFRTRLDLKNHQFSKSQRKLMRRNAARFRVEVHDDDLLPEQFEIEQRYRDYRGRPGENALLAVIRGTYVKQNYFPTRQLRLYDGERLAAFSFFDVGERYGASLMGVFEPEYERFSLGYYTMLLEIDYLKKHRFAYYAPGSVTPGQQAMDYKRRVGPLEYFNAFRRRWLPLATQNEAEDLPVKTVCEQLNALRALLRNSDIPAEVGVYERYAFPPEMVDREIGRYRNYASPIGLWVLPPSFARQYMVNYDWIRRCFRIYECAQVGELQLSPNHNSYGAPTLFNGLFHHPTYYRRADLTGTAQYLAELYRSVVG